MDQPRVVPEPVEYALATFIVLGVVAVMNASMACALTGMLIKRFRGR